MGVLGAPRRVAWALWQRRYVSASPEEIAAVQRRALRRLVKHAAARSPFYREKYAGIDLDRCEPADLPVVTKDELTARFDEAVTEPRVKQADLARFVTDPENAARRFLGWYIVSHTSGSQGRPLLIVMDPKVIERVFAYQFTRGNPSYGQTGPKEIIRRLREPARIAIVVHKREWIPSATAWHHQPGMSKLYARPRWFSACATDLAERLGDYRPHVITAYPSVLEVLALQKNRLRLAPELRHVVAMSESVTGPARRRIAEAFGVPITDTYGTGECLFLTNGCPAGPGMHVNADSAILEVVDDDYRPVPPGEAGTRVLLTNLVNRVQPFIRYELGDRVVMADRPCGCGGSSGSRGGRRTSSGSAPATATGPSTATRSRTPSRRRAPCGNGRRCRRTGTGWCSGSSRCPRRRSIARTCGDG